MGKRATLTELDRRWLQACLSLIEWSSTTVVQEAFYCVSRHRHNSVIHTCSTLALKVARKWSHWRRKQTVGWRNREPGVWKWHWLPPPLPTATPHLLNPRPAVFPALYIYWLRYMNTSLDMSACDMPQSRTMACFPFVCFLSFTKGKSSARIKEGLIPSQVLEEKIRYVVWSPESFRVQHEREIQKQSKGIEKTTKS